MQSLNKTSEWSWVDECGRKGKYESSFSLLSTDLPVSVKKNQKEKIIYSGKRW